MKILFTILTVLILVSCNTGKQQDSKKGEVEIVLISAQSRDTIFKQIQDDLNEVVKFDCPKSVRDDAAVLLFTVGKGSSMSRVVPEQAGRKKRKK